MKNKVALNVFVSPQIRTLLKVQAAKEGVTMASLLERIIVGWKNTQSCDQIFSQDN